VKSSARDTIQWYPYQTLASFSPLHSILKGPFRRLFDPSNEGPIADIGSADGDLAFFLESLGHEVHVIDYPPTNYNALRGLRKLREMLGSKITISEINLDVQFHLPIIFFWLTRSPHLKRIMIRLTIGYFSRAGLHRILDRTGWDICCYGTDPSSANKDERAFCLIRSRSSKVWITF
jgi:tRNA (mo5U34)-methyltransferase